MSDIKGLNLVDFHIKQELLTWYDAITKQNYISNMRIDCKTTSFSHKWFVQKVSGLEL